MPRKFDFLSLELFVTVCECRSITHAAERENITASAVSKRISQLEQVVGAPLLSRTHSGVSPTAEGLRLLEHARNVLYSLDVIEREVARGDSLRGFVRILANPAAVAEFVPAAVASFLACQRHRHIDVQIGESASQQVVMGVKSGLAAVGVCWADVDMGGVQWMPARCDDLSVVVPHGHPLARRPGVAFGETLDYDQVGIHPAGPITDHLRRESVRRGRLLRYRIVAPTYEAMVQFVEAGLAIAILPTGIGRRFALAGRVATVRLTDGWNDRQFAICCRSQHSLQGPAAALFNHLVAQVGSTVGSGTAEIASGQGRSSEAR